MSESKSVTPDMVSETWFLEQLEVQPLPLDRLNSVLDHFVEIGALAQAEDRAQYLQQTLVEQGDRLSAIDILQRRAGWTAMTAGRLRQESTEILENDGDRRTMVDHAGFDRNLQPAECMRRLALLVRLGPGLVVYDKTWGVGEVRRVEPLHSKVEIDFESKAGHQMSFAYAAETLRILAPDHVLYRWRREPDGIRSMATEKPDALVKLAIRSFGPQTIPQLQSLFSPRVFPESGWKTFWDGARKGLKKDPCVVIPSKRTDPIVLLEQGETYGTAWFETLAKERDAARLLERIAELAESDRAASLSPEERRILGDRLQYVVTVGVVNGPAWGARAALAARAFPDPAGLLPIERIAEKSLDPAHFDEVLEGLSVRDIDRWLTFLADWRGDEFLDRLLQLLPTLGNAPLNEALDLLSARGRDEAIAAFWRDSFARQKVTPQMMAWIFRHPDRRRAWNLCTPQMLWKLVMPILEDRLSGDALKAQNTIREKFDKPEWLEELIDHLMPDQQREFMLRMKETQGWPMLDRQAMLGRIVKMYPDLEQWLAQTPAPAVETKKGPLTSERMYHVRQKQLHKLVTVEIPNNSREIGVARSYGDLRENFEYKAAKDMQSVLMRRQAELEQMLKSVMPSNFEGFPTDRAGLATGVVLQYPDGREETYYILGAWDRDEALRIISSDTKMAAALIGRSPGDRVMVPTEHGEIEVVLKAVLPLPDAVKDWIRADVEAPAAE